MAARRETREFSAAGGRRLMVEVAGPSDGDLAIFHTGTPGSRYLFEGTVRACARRGLRVACISRPGYDGSDPLPGRTYADGPADTAVVADGLGAERFYVFGHSGGGGPTLADAAFLPDRVRSAAAVATLAPRSAQRRGLDWTAGLQAPVTDEMEALEAGDSELRDCLERMAAAMRGDDAEAVRGNPLFSAADRESMVGEFLDYQLRSFPLAVRGGVSGWFEDDKVIYGEWGFDLAAISVPVAIWQGGQDNVIPAAHGRWLADNVPGARFHLLPDEGHVSPMARRYGELLDELIELGA